MSTNTIEEKVYSNSRQMKNDRVIEYIIKVVGNYYGVGMDYSQVKSRKRELVVARQVAMYFSNKYTNATLHVISEHFNGKNHATVLHAIKQVANLCETDKEFKKQVKDLKQIIELNAKSVEANVNLNDSFYYINFNDFYSIKFNNHKGIMLSGFSDEEFEQLLHVLKNVKETRKHENTGIYILEEKTKEQ